MEEIKEPKFFISLMNKPTIINRGIYLFLYHLLKRIFMNSNRRNSNSLDEHLKKWIDKINKDIIKKNEYFIDIKYSFENLRNIIYFAKSQNMKYNGDIIESILIFIFSKAFKTEQDNSFCKYIFNNLTKIRESGKSDLISWIQKGKLSNNIKEFQKLEDLFDKDDKEEDNQIGKIKEENVFYNFLKEILKAKYPKNILYKNSNLIAEKYIQNTSFNFNIFNAIYKQIKKYHETISDKDIAINSIMNHISSLYSSSTNIKPINQLILSFFTQVYIFYQNKYSPLMKYTIPKENLATIPFVYDLRGACIEGRFSHTILSPLMVQDFVSKIFLKQNNFREAGLFELGKILIFNDKVKSIECDTCLIQSYYLGFLIYAMGLFDNHSVEELNLSYNYLHEQSEEYIIKILTHFKELKTLNLSNNEMKKGLGNVFLALKKLYRQKKTKVENLILNKCLLDDSSLYELGELLKSKFCKLKKLVLNNNSFPNNINILKAIKRNKILEEIYFNKTDINNSSIEDILKIISNTNIKHLYLFKNKLTNFNDFLRILYRTKIVNKNKENNKVILNEDTSLINLDLSNNEYSLKNHLHIKLLKKIIEETSLYCLDICHILYGINPEKWKETQGNIEYKKSVEEIKNYLEEKKKEYFELVKDIRINEVDIKKNKSLEENDDLKKFIKKEQIDGILKNKNAKFSGFLMSEADKIIDNFYESKFNFDDLDIVENTRENLRNYLILKRAEKNLIEMMVRKHKKKLIII